MAKTTTQTAGPVWRGEEQLRPLLAPVADLQLDPRNARRHPERNIEAVVASLERFGQQKPIVVDADGVIVAGNGTFQGARRLGWTHVAAVRTALAGAERDAFGVADNRTGELAEWDYEALSALLSDDPVENIGWSEDDLAVLKGLLDPALAGAEDPGPAVQSDPFAAGPKVIVMLVNDVGQEAIERAAVVAADALTAAGIPVRGVVTKAR